MTHCEYRLTCDKCRNVENNDGYDNEAELLKNSEKAGWTFRKVQNGSIWDFCPKCSKLEDEKSIIPNVKFTRSPSDAAQTKNL